MTFKTKGLLSISSFFLLIILVPLLFSIPAAASSKIRVAIVPWQINGPEEVGYLKSALRDMLQSRVGANDRIEMVRADVIEKAFTELRVTSLNENMARGLADKVGADYILFGSMSLIADAISLDAILIEKYSGKAVPLFSSGKGMGSIVELAGTVAKEATGHIISGDVARRKGLGTYTGKFTSDDPDVVVLNRELDESGIVVVKKDPRAARSLKWRSRAFEDFSKSFAIADLDGDGTLEFIIMSSNNIIITRATGDGVEVVTEIPASGDTQNLHVSAGDIDGDGTDELYLARISSGNPDSVMIAFANGNYTIIKDPIIGKYLVRVIDVEGSGNTLIAQGFRPDTGFLKKVVRLNINEKGYYVDGKFSLPSKVAKGGIFGFVKFDLDGDGVNEVISVGKGRRLHIYNQKKNGKWVTFWESPTEYGGSLNHIEMPKLRQDTYSHSFVTVFNNFSWADLDNDGVKEVILTQNDAGAVGRFKEKVTRYVSGAVISVSWDVALLQENWRTKDLSGYIADLKVADIDGDGKNELTVLVVEGIATLFKKNSARSHLIAYTLQ